MNKQKNRTQELISTCHELHYESSRDEPSLLSCYQRHAKRLLTPEAMPEMAQGEVIPEANRENAVIRNTLENPNTAAVDASLERTALLQRVDAVEMGIDAAQSIEARNSLEKMLAHQMAACHVNAFKLLSEISDREALPTTMRYNQNAEMLMIKKINLAARLMDVFQKGFETLTKARTAGKQTIEVKQIHVTGGQNVIADKVGTGGGRKKGEDSKNDDTP